MSEFQLLERNPSVGEYQRLRRAVGWYVLDDEATERGLQNSLYSVCLMRAKQVVGCGRVIGDSGIYYYVQDIIVLPEFQGRGGGAMIMEAIMQYLQAHASTNSFIGLMAAKDVADFYVKYGFSQRPPDRPGMFQVWPEKK
jgi:GNAT superfamily N-acetyltransferase